MVLRHSIGLVLLLSSFAFAPAAGAQTLAELEPRAFGVLDKYCARCHQAGKLQGKYAKEGPAKGFGYVLDPKELLKKKRLVAGNPDSSPLFIRVAVQKDMPPQSDDCLSGAAPEGTLCAPNGEEVNTLRDYIAALGGDEPEDAVAGGDEAPEKGFVSDDDIIRAVADDLSRFTDIERKGKRYLTLTHFHNIGEDAKAMELYRQATVKLLNSLSTEPDAIPLETIDEAKTIIRFDIDDLGWDAEIWDRIVAANPYTVIYNNTLFKDFIVKSTHSVTPILRADWFTFAAAKPPLYYEILKLPDTQQELEKQQGLNSLKNIDAYRVARAGFQKSGVSSNNRMIERHQIATGAFWLSYDFGGNVNRQSLFRFPLGPPGTLGDLSKEFGFEQDGGEIIFALPNGYHAYYLAAADGKRLDQGPANIVVDNVTGRRDLLVTNGVSCFGCHTDGMKYNPNRPPEEQDEVRKTVLDALVVPPKVQEVVEALYPEPKDFAKLMKRDADAWADAQASGGLNPKLRDGNGREAINVLFNRFEEDLSAAQAAAELGFTKPEFLRKLNASGAEAYDLKLRLLRDAVPRDEFVAEFAKLVTELTRNEAVQFAEVKQNSKGVEVEIASAGDKVSTFDLAFYPNGEKFKLGELVTFSLKAAKDCHLNVYNIDQKGRIVFVFPNKFNQENQIKAGVKYQLPGDEIGGFQLRFKDLGKETFVAVCNATRPNPPGIEHDYAKAANTQYETYRSLFEETRSVEIEQAVKPGGDVLAQKGVVLVVKK